MTYAKIRISARLVLESGLHIGGNKAFSAIGAIDSPVIKDPITSEPIIPGSSLKGKIRTLLAKAFNKTIAENPSEDAEIISRLFGNSNDKKFGGKYRMGQVIFRDAYLLNGEQLRQKGSSLLTEVKFENTIDRISAEAKPRQIERAIRGSEFAFEMIYEVNPKYIDQVKEDLELLKAGLELLELDYLGGSGSRGYGKVKFEDVTAKTVFGEFEPPKVF